LKKPGYRLKQQYKKIGLIFEMNVLKTYPYFITTENDRNMFFIYLYVDDLITLEMIVIF
jgi:hypothetical protein